MPKPLDPTSREWFLERIYCTRLWEEWARVPASPGLRAALVESFEKLGLVRSSVGSAGVIEAGRDGVRRTT